MLFLSGKRVFLALNGCMRVLRCASSIALFATSTAMYVSSLYAQTTYTWKEALPAGNGPATTLSPIPLRVSAGVPAAAPVTVTLSLTNQQFAAGANDLDPTSPGMLFGVGNSATLAVPPPAALVGFLNPTPGGPVNAQLSALPTTPGAGVDVTTTYGASLFLVSDALVQAPATAGTATNVVPINSRVYYGDLNITFSAPITNPVIHLTGQGGSSNFSLSSEITAGGNVLERSYTVGFSNEFRLDSVNGSPAAANTLVRLSGSTFFDVNPTTGDITNTSPLFGAASAGGELTPAWDTVAAGGGRSGNSGSIMVTANAVTSIKLRVYLHGDGGRVISRVRSPLATPAASVVTIGTPYFTDAALLAAFPGVTNASLTLSPLWSRTANLQNPAPLGSTIAQSDGVSGDLSRISFSVGFSVKGNVFTDLTADSTVNGAAVDGGAAPFTSLTAYLVNGAGTIIGKADVAADGSYQMLGVPAGTGYSIRLSNNNTGTVGGAAPAASLPSGYINTGEQIGTTVGGQESGAGAANGVSPTFSVVDRDVTDVNFGMRPPPVGVSGNVYNDVNGLNDAGGAVANGAAVDGQSATFSNLTAYLVNSLGQIVASSDVNGTGAYSFANVTPANGYTVVLSNTPGLTGAAPTPSLPAGWENVSDQVGTTASGATNATPGVSPSFDVSTTNVTNVNFGIEQPPTATGTNVASQNNPGGTTSVTVPPSSFGATDPAPGAVTSYSFTGAFPANATTITIAGVPYTAANWATRPASFATLPSVAVDPVDGAVTVTLPYTVSDAAGLTASSQVQVPFGGGFMVSGTVWNDANDTANGAFPPNINANTPTIDPGTDAGASINAVLVNSAGVVIRVVPVAANGTYSFANVPAGSGYQTLITTASPAVGSTITPATTASLPTGWVGTSPLVMTPFNVTADVANKDFGIERPPLASIAVSPSQVNPGGTTQVQAPTLAGTDAEDGAIGTGGTFIINTVPDPTTQGNLYYNGTLVTPSTTITNYNPALLTIDPVNGNVTVTFTYSSVDKAGEASQPANAAAPFVTLTVSGTVYDDANGSAGSTPNGAGTFPTINGAGEVTTNAGGLNAVMLDAAGAVIAVVPVSAGGTYLFPNAPPNTSVSVLITSTNPSIGATGITPQLPTGWTNTSPLIYPPFNTGTTNTLNKDFGIEQPPSADNKTAASQPNPGGTVQVPVPALTGTDPENGSLGAGDTFTITTLPTNGTLYYNGSPVSPNTPIPNFNPSLLTIDPNDGALTVTFNYTVTDAAGKPSTPATVTMPFSQLTLTGTVFNDVDGSKVQNLPTEVAPTPAIYAVLLNSSNAVVATALIDSTTGAYSLPVSPNQTYSVILSTTAPALNAPNPPVTLPAGWVTTGENLNGAVEGTPDSKQSVSVGATNVVGVNFGIEQPPTATGVNVASQVNPGGSNSVTVPPTSFGATDPGPGGITSYSITGSFPTNADTITINGIPYTAANWNTLPTSFATLPSVEIDPVDGAVTVTIPYTVADAAGLTASSQVEVPFSAAPVSVSGNVYNDVNGLNDAGGALTNGSAVDGQSAPFTTLTAYLVNASNQIVASSDVDSTGAFTFANVSPATGYTVVLSNTAGLTGAAPAASLPAGWQNVSDQVGTTAGVATNATPGVSPSFDVTTANVTNVNFGIEEPPTATGTNVPSQANPGGTTSVTVPPANFGATDTSAVTGYSIIGAFPTNATTITIDGVPYTAANWNTLPASFATLPSVAIDPVDGAVTVTIPYTVSDAAGLTASSQIQVPFSPALVTVSGNVYNDVNGLNDAGGALTNGTSINGDTAPFTALTAYLVNSSGQIVASGDVNASGAFTFANVTPATGYTVVLSNTAGLTGAAPAASLPAGWQNVSDQVGTTAGDATNATPGASPSFDVTTANVTNVNFGIEEPPTATGTNVPSQSNPGGTTSVTVPPANFGAADPSPGAVTSYSITGAFPAGATTVTIAGVPYTAANWASRPASIATLPSVAIDPVDGAVTVTIPYTVTDAAGLTASSQVQVPFGPTYTVSGNVYNDVNGLNDVGGALTNGAAVNADAAPFTTLTAYLVNSSGQIVASSDVNASGAYSFANVSPATGYTVVLANSATLTGSNPAASLPAGWQNVSDHVGTTAGVATNATPGVSPSLDVVAANVTNVNFGIEQPPTATGTNVPSQSNPGGTTSVTVPPANFGATDPAPGAVTSYSFTGPFPANATTITIAGVPYTAANWASLPTSFATLPSVAIDPVDGAVTVTIPYTVSDAAGLTASSQVQVPFGPTYTVSGNVFNDVNGLNDAGGALANGVAVNGDTAPFSTLTTYLVNSVPAIVASSDVNASGAYSFANVSPATGYTVVLSNTAGLTGAVPSASLPAGWQNVSDQVGTTVGGATNATPGVSPSFDVTTANVTNVNFGIEEPPTATGTNVPSQPNPGGTTSVTVSPANFGASDPSPGAVTSYRLTGAFPANATTITIAGVPYTAANWNTLPTSFATLPSVAVDPVDGAVIVNLPYTVTDAAGLTASSQVQVPFGIQPADMVSSTSCLMSSQTQASCTVTCTNAGPGVALDAFCAVSNASSIPGAAITCSPNSASLGVGQTLTCNLTFPLTAGGSVKVIGGTGATNDSNGGTVAGGGNNPSAADISGMPIQVPSMTEFAKWMLALLLFVCGARASRRRDV